MKLSLKTKLTALIALLVLSVVVTISSLYLLGLIHQTLADMSNRGDELARATYEQANASLSQSHLPAGANPADPQVLLDFVRTRLQNDPDFLTFIQSAAAYQRGILYVTITNHSDNMALVHDDPPQVGRPLPPVRHFDELLHASLIQQFRVIYGPPQVYEIVFPIEIKPLLLDVRVGVSTALLADVKHQLLRAVKYSAAAILVATLLAALMASLMLRPLKTVSQSVDRLSRGEFISLNLKRADEWGVLSSKLNLLGEQIRGEKAAFSALKENLDQLFSNLADGLMLFDREDRLALATPAVARFLGRSVDEFLRRPAQEIFTADTPLENLIRAAFARRESLSQQALQQPGSDPSRVAVNVTFVEEGEQPVASLVTLRDAGSRAQLEDQIDVTAKLAAIGRLTSGVAHEVKNPLNAMVLQVELLKTKLSGQAEQAKPHLEVLGEEIRRLDRVVRTFLDFTRPVELHRTETPVQDLVADVFRLAEADARSHNVRLILEPNGALPPVRVDRDLIKQALLNLVLNGCQAMPSGGELRIAPHPLPDGVELQIIDQGVGIPLENRPKIFSLYYTTKPGGSGVGLAMTYRIIQLHNGSIDFSSEVNHGTTFRVCLPR